jgi:acyl carrier protein
LATAFVAPVSKTENTLIELMENFLGMGGLGVDDNFFELGCDSLMAMSFLIRARSTFGINLSIKSFFENPTAGKLSLKIDEIKLLTQKRNHSSKKII